MSECLIDLWPVLHGRHHESILHLLHIRHYRNDDSSQLYSKKRRIIGDLVDMNMRALLAPKARCGSICGHVIADYG